MTTEQKKVFKEAIKEYGFTAQYDMIVEECSELIQAIQKYKRNPCDKTFEHVCEEIADVENMTYQGGEMFDRAIIEDFKNRKIERLKDRLLARKIRKAA